MQVLLVDFAFDDMNTAKVLGKLMPRANIKGNFGIFGPMEGSSVESEALNAGELFSLLSFPLNSTLTLFFTHLMFPVPLIFPG